MRFMTLTVDEGRTGRFALFPKGAYTAVLFRSAVVLVSILGASLPSGVGHPQQTRLQWMNCASSQLAVCFHLLRAGLTNDRDVSHGSILDAQVAPVALPFQTLPLQ